MLLFRMGPRFLFIKSKYINEITNFLVTELSGEITDFQKGVEKSSEHSTLCFITDIIKDNNHIKDAKKIVLIYDGSSVILSTIINNRLCKYIDKIDIGPTSILMRLPGDEDKIINKVKTSFHGREVDWMDGIEVGKKNDTIIAFTKKMLSSPVSEFLGPKLLIPQHARIVQGKLRLEGLRLITQSLTDSQWYELRINIYDSYGRYKEHYDRLIFILSKLEIGMILGESWTKDYAVMLLSVLTYQVRLFTFFKPVEVKKILMALEYTIDGKRLVDFDLYYMNKKISWGNISSNKGRKNKLEDVKMYRKQLYEKLKPEDIKIFEDMEKALI